MGIRETFAANMRRYRKAAKLTQEQLAEKCGLHRTYIGGIEQRRVNPSLKNIGKIADALEVDPALLFMETPASKPLPKLAAPASNDQSEPKYEYALVQWSEEGVTVRPLSVRYDDMTIQVLLDLIGRGYRGEGLLRAYRHAHDEIRRFLDSRGRD